LINAFKAVSCPFRSSGGTSHVEGTAEVKTVSAIGPWDRVCALPELDRRVSAAAITFSVIIAFKLN
jgi:hypothetical protein